MKIELHYDPINGNISDNNGNFVATYMNLQDHEVSGVDQTEKLCKLKASGFQVNEIMQLIREGML